MPAQRDKIGAPGGDIADALARTLSDAVGFGANGNGHANGNGSHSGMDPEEARRLAADVGAAMLAKASAGTAEHSNDVVLIAEAIGERMAIKDTEAGDLLAAARLHDIGKVWVPRHQLEKAGPLSDEEWEVMRQHTLVGQRILSSVAELEEVGRLVRHSHERWDGGGYPDGLAGSEIPLGSRIIFCADAFHAIRSDRPYRAGRSAREALAEINRCAGTQFDPQVAGALEQVVHERGRRPKGMGGSSRLLALLMCLVIGGAGTAVARSGLLAEPSLTAPSPSAPKPPPACGTAACPIVAGPVGGLAPVGAPGSVSGARALSPGLPGGLHKHGQRGNHGLGNVNGKHGKSAAAKRRHAGKHKGKANGRGDGHAGKSSGNGQTRSEAAAPPSSAGSQGGGSSHQSGSHHSSGRHSSGGGGRSGGHRARGHSGGRSRSSSHSNAGGSGGGGPH
jgi:hypothetical protein